MTAIVPSDYITFEWDLPISNNCLPILEYVLNKDGNDLSDLTINADALQTNDDISVDGIIGTEITYKIKAVNIAGDSEYSEPLTITVGTVPNAPTNLVRVQ